MKNKTLWIGVAAVVVVVVVVAAIAVPLIKQRDKDQGPVACTMEAKQCPDGSYVGRQGPKCEFAQCPGQGVGGNVTAGINQTVTIDGITITPVDLSDSRCPSDVKCIWAGNVNARVKLGRTGTTTTMLSSFSIGTSSLIGGKKVTLTAVSPAKRSDSTIKNSDYRFTFLVTNAK